MKTLSLVNIISHLLTGGAGVVGLCFSVATVLTLSGSTNEVAYHSAMSASIAFGVMIIQSLQLAIRSRT